MNPGEKSLSVFTVDDSEVVFKNMGSLLTENQNINWLGHAFLIADAYTQIAEKKPELVILDIQLKEDTTFALLDFLTNKHPEIVIMMFTNLATPPYRKKCAELGAKYFLDKSVEFEKISQIVEEVLLNKVNHSAAGL